MYWVLTVMEIVCSLRGQEMSSLGFALFVKHVLHCSIAFFFWGGGGLGGEGSSCFIICV